MPTITSLIAAKQTVATFHNKHRKKDAIALFYGKKTSFIQLLKLFGLLQARSKNAMSAWLRETRF